MLALDYQAREIVVVNDGSSDDTLSVLKRTFELLPAPLAYMQPIATQHVRGIYRSIREPGLVVIDKENGRCKADAANAGINAASGELVLIIDADTVLEPDALSRAVMPFLEDPHTVAVGANIAIVNGCSIDDGRITDVALPRNWLARFQIMEYMRGFLLFRLGCALLNSVLIISGAFGLFRRDAVIAVGGYDPTAIGEDMDLTIRLQQYYRARRKPFRIAFDPNALAWTQAPDEGVGPLLELSGYVITTVAVVFGFLNWQHFQVLIVVSLLFGTAATLLAVLLSDIATQRYMGGRDLALLVVVAVLENFGYRQLNSWWGCVGTFQALTGTGGWGVMKRRAFAEEEAQV